MRASAVLTRDAFMVRWLGLNDWEKIGEEGDSRSSSLRASLDPQIFSFALPLWRILC